MTCVHPCMRRRRLEPVHPGAAGRRQREVIRLAAVGRGYLKTSNARGRSSGGIGGFDMKSIPPNIAAASSPTAAAAKTDDVPTGYIRAP